MTAPVPPRCAGRPSSTCSASRSLSRMDEQAYAERLAKLAVEGGANLQPDQALVVFYHPGMEPLVHAIAETAYKLGARFVDPVVFDGALKRIRLEHAREDTLDYVPE